MTNKRKTQPHAFEMFGMPPSIAMGMPPEAAAIYNAVRENRGPVASNEPVSVADQSDEELQRDLRTAETTIEKIRADARNDGRELTEREQGRIEQYQELAAMLEAELNARNPPRRKTEPEPLPGDRHAPQARWQTPDGEPIHCLAPKDRLANLASDGHRRGIETIVDSDGTRRTIDARNLPSIGAIIAAKITGRPGDFDMRNAMSEGIAGDGGYLVAPAVSRQMIDLARDASVVLRAGAQTVPMPTSELIMTRVTRDPDTAWVGENQLIPETDVGFGALKFKARKMAALVKISHELVEDSSNAAQVIQDALAAAMGAELDRAALKGDGADGGPIGILFAPGVQTVMPDGSPPVWSWDTILEAIEAIESVNGNPNAYLVNAYRKRALAALKNGSGDYLPPPADVAALTRLVTNKLANTEAVVGDFSQMLIGVRIPVTLEISREAGDAFQRDQIWIPARWRGDVQFARPEHFAQIVG